MQPNFEAMTNKELVAYALAHREDAEPLRELYRRRTPDEEATWYGPCVTKDGTPIEENIRIAEEAIKQRIELFTANFRYMRYIQPHPRFATPPRCGEGCTPFSCNML